MATITITIADADLPRVVDDICGLFGYQAFIPQIIGPPIANPETKNQFAKRMVVQDVKAWCKTWEQQQAKAAAEVTAGSSADLLGIS